MLFKTPKLVQWLYPGLEWRGQERHLYLTFDDGPIPEVTEYVLETLDHYTIKATFFCIGDNARKYPDILREVHSRGHQIGNHTMNHLNGWKTRDEVYIDNIRQCNDQINSVIPGLNTLLFRPPYGRIRRSQLRMLPKEIRTIMWTCLTQDYDQRLKPEDCLKGTLKTLTPGAVILFHDSLKAEKNLRFALPRVIEHALEQGYTFGLI